MNFPIVNISVKEWDENNLMDYITFDKFIYTDKDLIFDELYRDMLFCDCDGKIYKAIKKLDLTEKWRIWLRFIPNIWKREILFEPTGEIWTVDELREHLLNRVSKLTINKATKEWKVNLKTAENHLDLIMA